MDILYRPQPLYRAVARLHRAACRLGVARPTSAINHAQITNQVLRDLFGVHDTDAVDEETAGYGYLRFDRQGLEALANQATYSRLHVEVGTRPLAAAALGRSHETYLYDLVYGDSDDVVETQNAERWTLPGEGPDESVQADSDTFVAGDLVLATNTVGLGAFERKVLFNGPWEPRDGTVGDVFAELAQNPRAKVTDLVAIDRLARHAATLVAWDKLCAARYRVEFVADSDVFDEG
jgi:hypothetical protein